MLDNLFGQSQFNETTSEFEYSQRPYCINKKENPIRQKLSGSLTDD